MIDDGDSQETSPGGQGSLYNPLMAWELWRRYRNIPETQLQQVTSNGGVPPAALGIRAARYEATDAGTMPVAAFPYTQEAAVPNRFAVNGVSGLAPQAGFITVLQHNLNDVDPTITEISRSVEYIRRVGVQVGTLVPHRVAQPDELRYRCSSNTASSPNFFLADQLAANVDISAAQVEESNFTPLLLPYDFGGSQPTAANISSLYAQAVFKSSVATVFEAGPVYYASADKRGISFTPWSEGGRKTSDLFTDRPSCLNFVAVWAPDIIRLKCGANDAGQSLTDAQFKAAVEAKIATYRTRLPNAVFVLESDAGRSGLTAPQIAAMDLYADRLAEIAAVSSNRAVFVNVQRYLHERHRWFSGSPVFSSLMPDGVHYSLAGARLVASTCAKGLFDSVGLRPLLSSVRPLRQFGGLRRGATSSPTSFRIGS